MQNITSNLRSFLSKPLHNLHINGLNSPALAWLISSSSKELQKPLIIITPDQKSAERVINDLSFFSDRPILSYPCHDILPFAPVLPETETMARRLKTLYFLAEDGGPGFVIMPTQALAELTVSKERLISSAEYVEAGEGCDRDALLRWFTMSGYEHVSIVTSMGEFCSRGGIVDFFSPMIDQPVRLDFFDDMVEEIRLFDPLTQRSADRLDSCVILPASEIFFDKHTSEDLKTKIIKAAQEFDWPASHLSDTLHSISSCRITEKAGMLLPIINERQESVLSYIENLPIIIFNPADADTELLNYHRQCDEAWHDALAEHRTLSKAGEVTVQPKKIAKSLDKASLCFINVTDMIVKEKEDAPLSMLIKESDNIIETDVTPPSLPSYSLKASKGDELFGSILEKLVQLTEKGVFLCLVLHGTHQSERVAALFEHYNYEIPKLYENFRSDPGLFNKLSESPGICFVHGRISESFLSPDVKTLFLTDETIFNSSDRTTRTPSRRRKEQDPITWEDLKTGIHIVHKDHGIGLYNGLVRMKTGGIVGEYLQLEYHGGDKLYLPVDRLGLVHRYTGIEGREPRLDKLGSSSWKLRTSKVKASIYAIAHDLVDLYAGRRISQGRAFSPPSSMFRQFEAEFPYEETDDQLTSIQEILEDMQSPRPMDRLLCGDVGFGKTEVIMRAAFKAVEDGTQVGVLVPTTLLAEQHERTFKRRFRRFPVRIEALSRIKTKKEQSEIVKKTASGVTDILIGTHRMLQQDVRFKNIGLLIIDEEHRFGVTHKEKLKKIKQNIDSLSLTATPIPRTLQLSLLGIRDMSTITTPPVNRTAVKTFLAENSDSLIKGAILKEIERNGQVFFVHNRVQGIHKIADHLSRLVPKARLAVAHGQMESSELEAIMIKFVRGDIDCLVSTTIIESGIDIPSANTIIINRADKIGLAALYQLRGRVGRSAEQAYAYLLVPELSMLSTTARKRLTAIMDISRSGGGFKLAMKDLQIRGAGNILGVSQSGQIADVGYDLYLDLLKNAVEELKGIDRGIKIEPEVNLGISAVIPEEYVPDVEQRLRLYRQLSLISEEKEFATFSEEFIDRFGSMPHEVRNLVNLMSLKLLLAKARIMRLDLSSAKGTNRMIITFTSEGPLNPDAVIAVVSSRKKWKLLPDNRLAIEIFEKSEPEKIFESVKTGVTNLL